MSAAVEPNTREATAAVLHLLGFQLSSGPELTPSQLPHSELQTSRSFLTADNQFVVHATFQSAASKLSSHSEREAENARVPTVHKTSFVSNAPETGNRVHTNQETADTCFCHQASGKGQTGEETSTQVNDSCCDHSTRESAKIQAATATAPPPTETTTAAATTAATAPPPEAAASVMQKAETIPVQESQPPAHTCDSEAAKHSRSVELLSRYRRLLAENQELRRRQLCRQCRHRAANVTLLPCGHLLYCQDCANELTHCGVCHREILADVKTYVC